MNRPETTGMRLFCDRLIEAGWLLALVVTPLFFNVHSNRIFEPDKGLLLRFIALVMGLAWLVREIEGWRLRRTSGGAVTGRWRAVGAVPLLLPALLWLVDQALSTLASVAPGVSLWGSYHRLQGLYTAGAYVMVFTSILLLLRTREQLERLVTTVLLAGLAVALYGLWQHEGVDPYPWAADVAARVSSTLGNPIFTGAWLMMVVPLGLYRLLEAGQEVRAAGVSGRGALGAAFATGGLQIAAWSYGPVTGLAAALVLVAVWLLGARGSGKPIRPFVRMGTYTVILGTCLLAIAYTQSRGPWLGLLAALFFFALLGAVMRHRWRRVLGIAGGGLALALVLGLLNVPGGPLEAVRPQAGRLGQLLEAGAGTGRVRVLLWEGAAELVGASPARMVVGYGPETMALVYPPYYPAELGRLERRDAVPDRAHNETFDVLITTGFLGLGVYLLLLTSLVYYALRGVGLLDRPPQRTAFLGYWLGGAVGVALLLRVVDGSWRWGGVAVPLGLLGGLFVFLLVQGYRRRGREAEGPVAPHRWLLLALLAGLLGHLVESHLGVAVTATRTYFWAYAALIGVVPLVFRPVPGRASGARVPAKPLPTEGRNDYRRRLVASSMVVGVILVTLVYGFQGSAAQLGVQPLVPALLALVALLGGGLVLAEAGTVTGGRRRGGLKAVGRYAGLVGGMVVGYDLLHRAVLGLEGGALHVPVLYAAVLLVGAVALAAVLLLGVSWPSATPAPGWGLVYALLAIGLFVVGYRTTLNPLRADGYARLARTEAASEPGRAVALYRQAVALAPRETTYRTLLGRALLVQARQVTALAVRETLVRQAEKALLAAYRRVPDNVEHVVNLARLYQARAQLASAPEERRRARDRAADLFEAATRRNPHVAPLWNERGAFYLQHGDTTRALEMYWRARALDESFSRTHLLIGEVYLAQGRWEEAAHHLERASRLQPPLPRARAALAWVRARMAGEDGATRPEAEAPPDR